MKGLLLTLTSLLFLLQPVFSQDQALREPLELAYQRWKKAVEAQDARAWAAAITMHRQIVTRNLIISQGLPFPKAVFETILAPAEVRGLRLLEAQAVGETAHLLYFGRVDMGGEADIIPENLLMLKFFNENGTWKFDSNKLIQLSSQPEVKAQLQKGDAVDFLDLPEFTPPGRPPAAPPLCEVPDYITGCTLQSIGYETTLFVNGQEHYVNDTIRKIFITGGLKKGKNEVRLQTKPVEVPKDVKRVLEIDFFIKPTSSTEASKRVFHFDHSGESPPKTSSTYQLTMPAETELTIHSGS